MNQREEMLEICRDEKLFSKFQLETGLAAIRHFVQGFIVGIVAGGMIGVLVGGMIVILARLLAG